MKIKREDLTEKQKRIIGITSFVCFILFCAMVGWFVGRPMVEFVSEPENFRNWVDKSGIWGRIVFVGMTALQVVVALIPGEPLEIGAGYAFSAIEGTLLCVIGITVGSLIVFSLVRRFGIRLVEIFFSRKKINSLRFLKSSKKRDFLIFTVFFLPGTPKDLLTYFAGITDIGFWHFLLLASVARLPSIVTSTLGGNALGDKQYIVAVIVFAITMLVSGAGALVYKYIQKKRNK